MIPVSARDSLAHPPIVLLLISNGLRFATVLLGFVIRPDLSSSCPLFIHMHSALRITHYMYLLPSQYLRSLAVRLELSCPLS